MMFPMSTSCRMLLLFVLSVQQHVGASPTRPDSPAPRSLVPTVKLDQATFIGAPTNLTANVNNFLGIPYAEPPIGDLRLRHPVANKPYTLSTRLATSFGAACFQQSTNLNVPAGFNIPLDTILTVAKDTPPAPVLTGEDCLTVNVWKPASATSKSRLPVLVWIYGGGFETGGSSSYDGSAIVSRSISMNQPIVFVSLNYRLNGFGFLAGKEVKAAGVANLGLYDQRQALRWIQKYISAFGGDPTKVTIQGESAGGISVALQMVTNNGNTEGLFRGAVMESGSPIPIGDISEGQPYYDEIVADVGCSSSSDTLACLRKVPYATLTAAINKTPNIFAYQSLKEAFVPRVDGAFLKAPPFDLVLAGSVAKIPFMTGDCDDEGTLFSIGNGNVTTDEEFVTYMKTYYLPKATAAQLAELQILYPQDPAAGSPFDTGNASAVTPEFKRLAAVQGDLIFQGPRRFLLQNVARKQKAWSFSYKRGKSLAVLGSFHGTDVLNLFAGDELAEYSIAFATSQNPNGARLGPSWPTWSTQSPVSMALVDGSTSLELIPDTYREAPINFLNSLVLAHPI